MFALSQLAHISAYVQNPTKKTLDAWEQERMYRENPALLKNLIEKNVNIASQANFNAWIQNVLPHVPKNNNTKKQSNSKKNNTTQNNRKKNNDFVPQRKNKDVTLGMLVMMMLQHWKTLSKAGLGVKPGMLKDVFMRVDPINDVPLKRPVIEQIIEQAIIDIQSYTGVLIEIESYRTNMEADEALVGLVKIFNKTETKKQIKLYSGIDGSVIVHPSPIASSSNGYTLFNMIRLGHMLVPVGEATVSIQLKTPNVSNAKVNVVNEGVQNGLREVQHFDVSVRTHVAKTKSVVQVISYPLGQKMIYSPMNANNQRVPEKQYLYQGILPSTFRRNGSVYCYVLSKFPPSVAFDIADTQKRDRSQPVDNTVDLHDTVMKSVLKKKWTRPRIIKNSTPEDLGVIVAISLGAATMLSSMMMVI
jgi:hypothetical protein